MGLRAKKPEVKEKRLKMFVFGPAGVGKTTAVIKFPSAYIVDAERGCDFYAESINKSGSVVFNSLNPDEIREEVHALLTEKHEYRTLIIDPITQVYNATQEKWTRIFEKYAKNQKDADVQDFGMRYWSKVKGDFKALQRLILALDMNVIITSHQKDVYSAGFSKVGVTFDSMKGDDYLFDLVFRVERQGTKLVAYKIKERAEVGKDKFPESFEWSYDNFLKYYGQEVIEREAVPVEMATEEQVKRINQLMQVITVPDDIINKWFSKFDVSDWTEMSKAEIDSCINTIQKKLDSIEGGK